MNLLISNKHARFLLSVARKMSLTNGEAPAPVAPSLRPEEEGGGGGKKIKRKHCEPRLADVEATASGIAQPDSISSTAFGIEVDRCSGSFSEMPRLAQPGDDWTPTGVCKDLTSIKTDVDYLVCKLDKGKKRGGGETSADVRKDVICALKAISKRLSTVRDSALECFEEFNHAKIFQSADPEVNGYDILLQSTPEPPGWACKDKVVNGRKRKQAATATPSLSTWKRKRKKLRTTEDRKKKKSSGKTAAEAAAPTPAPVPPEKLTMESVLDENIPLRSET